jgi:anti-sigma factor RsiW
MTTPIIGKPESGAAIDELDLQAYIDAQIAPGSHRAREIEAWLAQNPDVRIHVEHQLRQNSLLRAAYAAPFEAPIPQNLDPVRIAARIRQERHQNRHRVRRGGYAVAATFVLGVAGLMLYSGGEPDPLEQFADTAGLQAFGAPQDAPIQALNVAALPSEWPDLANSGLSFEALHQLDEAGLSFEVRYRDVENNLVQLYVGERQLQQGGELRQRHHGDERLIYWQQDGRMFALTGAMPPEALDQIAIAASEQRPAQLTVAGSDRVNPPQAPAQAPIGGETRPVSSDSMREPMSPPMVEELELLDMQM